MFTGIIEESGVVKSISRENTNIIFEVEAQMTPELKVDQSLAHNGVCLTVTGFGQNQKTYTVTAIDETLRRTALGSLREGDAVNLERCMQMNGRLDGHIVQGHVDQKGKVTKVEDVNGSWRFYFEYENHNDITVEKGSITVNGVSLTVVDSAPGKFSVAVIPYTYEHTNFKSLKPGDEVNLEFDVIGKYVGAYLAQRAGE